MINIIKTLLYEDPIIRLLKKLFKRFLYMKTI